MNEKEILDKVKELQENCECWLEDKNTPQETIAWFKMEKTAIQGLLDLYNQEKEKNKKIKNELRKLQDNNLKFKDSIVFEHIKDILQESER